MCKLILLIFRVYIFEFNCQYASNNRNDFLSYNNISLSNTSFDQSYNNNSLSNNSLNQLNSEIIKLKNEINNKDNIIKELNLTITNLKNKLNNINNINNNNLNIIKTLENNINEKEKELKNLKIKLNPSYNKIGFAISFFNHEINFPIICNENDLISRLEEELYNEYPNYKEYNTYLTCNGIILKRFKTIKENNIKKGNIILVNIPQ